MRMQFFDKPDKSFLQEGWDFLTRIGNSTKKCKIFRPVIFPSTWSSAFAEISFDNLAAFFRTKGWKIFDECPKTVYHFFLPRKTFLPPRRVDCCFDDPCTKILTRSQFFSAHCPEMKRKSWIVFFYFTVIKLFLWTNGMRFRQSLQKYVARRSVSFHSFSENDTKFLFVRNIKYFSTCSSAHVECNFDNPRKNFGDRPEKFAQLPKVIEEVQFFGKFSPKIVLMDRWTECTLANPIKNLQQKAEKLTLTARKWRRKYFLMRSIFSPEVFLWSR